MFPPPRPEIRSAVRNAAMRPATSTAPMSELTYQYPEEAIVPGLTAQQSLEKFRNMVACDTSWFDPASCQGLGAGGPDALPLGALYGGTRTYTVTPANCDGVGGSGDCFKVVTKVSWTPPQ